MLSFLAFLAQLGIMVWWARRSKGCRMLLYNSRKMSGDGDLVLGGDGALVVEELSTGA